MSADLPDDDELLAAELAFGLLDAAERRAAEARLGSDPAFADAHARWQRHASVMFEDRAEAPGAHVWDAIKARVPANDPAPEFRLLRWWRAGTFAAAAVALALGIFALQKPETVIVHVPVSQEPAKPLVAVLTGEKGFATVSFDPTSGHITSAAGGLDVGDHSPELWVIPGDGRPRSMGVMDPSAPGWAKVPASASSAMTAGVTIAISVEPPGGSRTGQPTGPVILTGKLTKI